MKKTQKYRFPLNFNYSNKFLGLVEYKSLLPLILYGLILFTILFLLNLNFFISAGIFTFLFLPFILLIFLGVFHEPFIPFLLNLIRFNKISKIYLYEKHCKIYEKTILSI